MLEKFSFQRADVFHSVGKGIVLVVLLAGNLAAQQIYLFALRLDLLGLFVQMVANVAQLCFGKLAHGYLAIWAWGGFGCPVVDPCCANISLSGRRVAQRCGSEGFGMLSQVGVGILRHNTGLAGCDGERVREGSL